MVPRYAHPEDTMQLTNLAHAATDIAPDLRVIRRNGSVTACDAAKINLALSNAVLAVEGAAAGDSRRIHDTAAALTQQVVAALTRHLNDSATLHIEDIQDQVELALMRGGHHKVARAYVLYRTERERERAALEPEQAVTEPTLNILLEDGSSSPLNRDHLAQLVDDACANLSDVDAERVLNETLRNLYDGMPEQEIHHALVM